VAAAHGHQPAAALWAGRQGMASQNYSDSTWGAMRRRAARCGIGADHQDEDGNAGCARRITNHDESGRAA
jgi:hypothetical protein